MAGGGGDLDQRARDGLQLMRQGRRDEAVAAFEAVLAQAPAHVGALISLGSARFAAKDLAGAEALYRRALAAQPRQPTALRNLAVLLAEQERHADALALADAALAAEPAHTEALLARGNALTGLGDHAEAAEAYRAAARHPAAAYEALTKLGLALAAQGDGKAALQALDRAVALKPDDPLARYRRGLVRLRRHDFAGGWPDYEARWRLGPFIAQSAGFMPGPMIPLLDLDSPPEAFAGQRVLLLGEQGLGDQVMFASALPDLVRLAGQVTCICDARLARLFAASFPDVRVLAPGEAAIPRDAVDKVLAMGSLGRLFRTRAEAFPGAPYLRPTPEALQRWADRLGPRPAGLRIGLTWRGGAPTTRRGARSLDLAQLRPILELPDCEVVSLQHGDVAGEIEAAGATLPRPIRAFPADDLHDLEDLAALAAQMDVVVSVQTTVAHLCGALGVPAHVLVPQHPEWRYGDSGETIPWYASVRILRQDRLGDWAPVVRQAADALSARLGR